MSRTVFVLAGVCILLVCAGCVHVHQLVQMEHEGNGTITETIKVLPRAIRLLEGKKTRKGATEEHFGLLSEQAIERRKKTFGEVTLKSKEAKKLENGALQLTVVWEFKDVNKVKFYSPPTFKCSDPKRNGNLNFTYRRIVRGHGRNPKYYKKDQMGIRFRRHPKQKKYSSPEIVQKYRNVTPIFTDMLEDFKYEIQIQAPKDLESFEDKRGMVKGMPIDGNIVTPVRVYGKNAVLNSELIRGFLMGEVGGRSDAWGGTYRKMERALPDTFTPFGSDYYGMGVHFFKTIEVPPPAKKEGK
jgi:hypothetical protein